MDKIEELKFIINRYDHYFDSINNKGNLYLTINTFILGGTIVGFTALNDIYHFNNKVIVLLILTLVGNIISFIYTLAAIDPFIKKQKPLNLEALMFFGEVSRFTLPHWKSNWQSVTPDKWKNELEEQSHQLAKGLSIKFIHLRRATIFIGIQIFFISLFGIILLTL